MCQGLSLGDVSQRGRGPAPPPGAGLSGEGPHLCPTWWSSRCTLAASAFAAARDVHSNEVTARAQWDRCSNCSPRFPRSSGGDLSARHRDDPDPERSVTVKVEIAETPAQLHTDSRTDVRSRRTPAWPSSGSARRPRHVLDEGHVDPAVDRVLGPNGQILRILDMAPCLADPCRVYDPKVAFRARSR